MDKYSDNRNSDPDDDKTGEIMSWVIIFILMVAFWPIGLLVLLKKLNVFAKPSGNTAKKKGDSTVNNSQRPWAQYKKSTSEAEQAAREAASNIANTAREVGNEARKAISEIYADLKREFEGAQHGQSQSGQSQYGQPQSGQSQYGQPQPGQSQYGQPQSGQQQYEQSQSGQSQYNQRPGAWKSATTQSPSWQSLGSRPGQSATQQPRTARHASAQPAAWRPAASQSATPWTASPQSRKSKAKIRKERTILEKKSGKFVSFILLLISIALFTLGVNTAAFAARDIWGNGIDRWPELILGAFLVLGGFITFFARNISVRRLARYKRYYVFVSGRGVVPIPEIARAAGLSARVVKRDLQAMINEGYLDKEAYIDRDLDCIVLTADAAEEARRSAKSSAEESTPASSETSTSQYMNTILELREINRSIADVSISEKVDQIEELTGKIFRIVEDNPEKLSQIRRFTNYYLPVTLKLLRAYATLEKQGIDGENITSTKESIDRILVTLTTGYKQQLDQLFQADAIDIAADINVLESLMQQDGLTENKPELKTMETP